MVEPERLQMGIWRCVACRVRLEAHKHTPEAQYLRPDTQSPAHTNREICNIFLFFHGNNGFVNAPHCYVIRTLALVYFAFFILQAVCCYCSVYFSFALTDDGRSCFQDYPPTPSFHSSDSNENAFQSSSISSHLQYYTPLPTPPHTCSCGCTDNWRSSQRIYPINFRLVCMAVEDGGFY
jgi:hypothetical protein